MSRAVYEQPGYLDHAPEPVYDHPLDRGYRPDYGYLPVGGAAPRRSLLTRLGPVGVAAIIAALLVSFGIATAAVSVFRGDDTPVAQAPFDEPALPVEPSAPAVPPVASAAPSGSPSAGADPSATTSATAAARVTTDPGQEAAVVGLLNQERARTRCRRPLGMDDRLRGAARGHSADMASRNFFSHAGSDGSSPEQRMAAAGFGRPLAENLARGQRSARDVVRAWMGSPEHRRNILNCDARAVGVGLAVRNGNDPFWTLDLGR